MAYYRLPRLPNAYDYERAANYYKKHGDSAKHYEMRAKQLERELHDREDARLRKEWSKYDW